MTTVCWLGLGHMGLPMASHLSSRGYEVRGFDPSADALDAARAASITPCASPAEAAHAADAVFTMLPTYAHVDHVLSQPGLLESTAPDALVVDCSTISGTDARNLGALVAPTGRQFLDAPVSGGTPGAHAGTLTFMVGGPGDAVTRLTPYLQAMGSRTFHVGETGCGQSAKTVNNMMLAMNMASVAEAAALGAELGLDHNTLVDIVKVSSGDSWVLRNFYPVPGVVDNAPANNDFEPGFTVNLMRKDVGLALASADDHGVDLGMTTEVARRLDRLIESGRGGKDFSVLVQLASNYTHAEVLS
ncbi:3-hydroxyisobutyrate dehydrogenase [Rhodococcus sp. NBC_00294]|uniref:3-hydroxyisobutyrate dehydrogenase n=1 Tax=Rhodococcus sp. NBC_00294 TaxID=2976004 RepID=UPI002E2CFADD|nr:3-hydroxyisobutyrate dehydrogenase [Rhodococcus sp. NBC_00294]